MRWRAVVAALLAYYTVVAGAGLVFQVGNSTDPFLRVFPIIFLGYAIAGAVILLRTGGNVVGGLLLAMALFFATGFFSQEYAIYGIVTRPGSLPIPELATWLSLWTFYAMLMSLLPIIFLFPSGSLPSRRWRPVFIAVIAFISVALIGFAFGTPFSEERPELRNPFLVPALIPLYEFVVGTFFIFAISLALAIASLVARARRAVGAERQQLKWIGATAAYILAVLVLGELVAPEGLLSDLLWLSVVSALPVGIAIAILRYRLYDIDVLINRALVYGALSAALLATYAGSVLALSALLRPIAGSGDLAVAGSTLAVVGLFAPLRSRIQRTVDRRFYRSRYDASRALDRFGARLRDEVDLDAVRDDLLSVVGETLRPAHASVWLRGPSR